ncbi:MAG: 4-(cytidine 5'-diphospho)-2-C-methyl-D-erythritol kinase [Bacteroidetes bacterium]|nr:4-(cytidine 5'-diphospho)-2-C-methyl-D-erythritol kinase [Bacteroidota bacterium]
MIVFPNCKINLGLRILSKREDGFHQLETTFYPIPVHDVLEILPVGNKKKGTVKFTQTGFSVQGPDDRNLCVKAYRLLQEKKPSLPAAYIHLHKNIPTGAGLGSGSADGVFTLLALQNVFGLSLSMEENQQMALQLGSDCPFFLHQQAALGKGRGEQLTPLPLSLSGYQILLIHPGFSIATAEAFQGVTPANEGESLAVTSAKPIEEWKNIVHNQFEETIFLKHPELEKIKNNLYKMGALYAAMSGSGSTLFGIFQPTASRPVHDPYPWVQWKKIP